MSKDVKIEIIYYKSDTDVSLEFGLHGKYPVRLLSSSSNDLPSYFNHLKRAVLRSEIIITVGGYNDNTAIPEFIAKAIGKETYVPNYNELGIMTEQKHPLPEGAVPLAPSSKLFGGFLIESGPQTIFSLTDDKKNRLDLVKETIVNYITEHHKFYANGYSVNEDSADSIEDTLSVLPEIPEKNVNEVQFNIPDTFEDISSLSEDYSNEISCFTTNESSEIENNENGLLEETKTDIVEPIEPDNADIINSETKQEDTYIDVISHKYTDGEDNILGGITPDDFVFDKSKITEPDDDEDFEVDVPVVLKTRPHRRILRVWCIILSLLIVFGTSAMVFVRNRGILLHASTSDYYQEINTVFNKHKNNLPNAFNAIKQYNSNFDAWITVNGTDINYPILSIDNNNGYYYNHLPNNTENLEGSVFTTSNVKEESYYQNIIIYGSAENNIGAFSAIVDLFKNSDISKIESITLYNSYSKSEWRIVSMFSESEADGFVFEIENFDSDAKYSAFLNQILRHNRTAQTAEIKNATSPMIMLIAKRGVKKFIICAAPYDDVSYIKTNNDTPSNNTSSDSSDILVDIEDAIIDFEEKTDENAGEFEQQPIDPDNSIPLPPVTVIPPSNDTSSESGTVSSKPTDTSSESSSKNESSTSSEQTSSSTTSSNVSSSENSSVESSSKEPTTNSSQVSSSESSSNVSSDNSSNTSSNNSSNNSSTNSSNNTSSENTGSNTKPNVDPMYTWDITLYVKQSNGTIVYGSATDIVARVIEAEMGGSFPLEALKAQAAAAYSWLLTNGATSSKTAPSGVPMKQTPSARCIQAVDEVKGTLITYNGTIAQTYYYAYSAGYSANVQDIWTANIPYLQSVECQVDTELSNFITTKTYTANKIKELILDKCGIDVNGMDKNEWLVPVQYDQNNTYCTYVEIGGVRYRGTYIRGKLLSNGIRSTAFTITYDEETDTFTFTCKGWGHGVGMSQQGAKAYANQGWTYDQILAHFYTGTTIYKY